MNPILAVVVFLLLFAVILIAVSVGYRYIEAERKKQVKGMLDVVSGGDGEGGGESILIDPKSDDPLEYILKGAGLGKPLEILLQRSGLGWSVSRLAGAMLLTGAAGVVLGVIFKPLFLASVSAAVFGALTSLIPLAYVKYTASNRQAKIEEQLPEALDFLARSMRAGHAFSISLEMLGQETPDPLGQEFRVLFNEQNLGAPIDVALLNLCDRVPLVDIRMFASSVLLQRQTGGNLSEILIRLAYIIRERFRLKGQVKAASAHGRLTAAILSILPVVLAVALMFVAPGYLQGMARDPDGQYMIIGCVVAQGLGYYFMRRITNIEV